MFRRWLTRQVGTVANDTRVERIEPIAIRKALPSNQFF